MTVLFGILFFMLLALYFRERAINKNLNKEVVYVRERLAALATASIAGENSYILIPSENPGIKELSAQLNRLLESFYLQKADYWRKQQAMDQMLTNISHDLRTPLTVLKGYSELLMKEMRKVSQLPDIQDMAAKIDQKANELVKTINEYFTMAKIESGDRKVDLRKTDITQLCHDVILDYYDILEQERYEVDIQIDDVPVYAYTDMDSLNRILKNLIDNAVKYGGSGKYLGIRLINLTEKVLIEIEDHGAGIAPEDLEQIFCRNYTTARKGTGSGLGLTIARNLALQMGAYIEVYSELGVKTVFTLSLSR